MSTTTASLLVACDLAETDGTLAHLTESQRARLDSARAALMSGDGAAGHAVSLVLDRQIRVPVYRWKQVERELARLAAKAESRGLPIPALVELDRGDHYITARILGGAPVFGGWRLVAELEQRTIKETRERVNIVRVAQGETCPEEYRAAPERCEHCSLARKRNHTFVIAHVDGRTMQVGSTCLDEYLGTEALAAWLTLGQLYGAIDGWGLEIWDDGEFARYRGHVSTWGRPIAVATFLAAVAADVRVHGFASSRSGGHPNVATGRSVWAAVQECEQTPVCAEDVARAEALLTFGRKLAGGSDFAHNVRTILASGEVRWLDANTVAALVPMLTAEEARKDEHLPHAAAGEVVVGEWRVKAISSYYSEAFGEWKYTVIFADVEGREIVWRTSSPSCKTITTIEDRAERRAAAEAHGGSADVQAGRTYRVVAKVKALGEYQGFSQTEITRASAYIPGAETASAKLSARKFAKAHALEVPEWAMTATQLRKKSNSS